MVLRDWPQTHYVVEDNFKLLILLYLPSALPCLAGVRFEWPGSVSLALEMGSGLDGKTLVDIPLDLRVFCYSQA